MTKFVRSSEAPSIMDTINSHPKCQVPNVIIRMSDKLLELEVPGLSEEDMKFVIAELKVKHPEAF